jgi:beta-phosphoglucomutase-like phosphatase (HAD superfamily)
MKSMRVPRQGSDPVVLTPARFDAVLFDLDGVVTDTARVREAAWAEMFDPLLQRWSQEHGVPFAPLSRQDSLSYFDGRPRTAAIRTFAAARNVPLPEGAPSDPAERDTVQGLAARRNRVFLDRIHDRGIEVYPSRVALIRRLRELGTRTALVTASRNCAEILRIAGLGPPLFH